jgi:hypothetical protein
VFIVVIIQKLKVIAQWDIKGEPSILPFQEIIGCWGEYLDLRERK